MMDGRFVIDEMAWGEKLRMRNFSGCPMDTFFSEKPLCLHNKVVRCPKGWAKSFTVKDLSLSNGHGEMRTGVRFLAPKG